MTTFLIVFICSALNAIIWFRAGYAQGERNTKAETVPYVWSCQNCHFTVSTNHIELTMRFADSHERQFH